MSRGLGAIQRGCLDALESNQEPLDSIAVAALVVRRNEITDSEHASVRRALRKLAKAGRVVDLGRRFRSGRRHWELPEEAEGINFDEVGITPGCFDAAREQVSVVLKDTRWRTLAVIGCLICQSSHIPLRLEGLGLGPLYLIEQALENGVKQGWIETRVASDGECEYRKVSGT